MLVNAFGFLALLSLISLLLGEEPRRPGDPYESPWIWTFGVR